MADPVGSDEEIIVPDEGAEGAEAVAEAPAPVDETSPEDLAVPEAADASPDGQLDRLRRDLAELNDKHLRLVAEFSNYRRRSEQERLGAWGRAQADVIARFLDVFDDLHRVAQLDLGNTTVEAIMEGVDLVERKFGRMLEDAGVEVIDPAGDRFDPARMEAIMRVPAERAEQDDGVAQVMQKGYSLKGVLVRPARVAVYKHG